MLRYMQSLLHRRITFKTVATSTKQFRTLANAGRIDDVFKILDPFNHILKESDSKRYINLLRRCLKSGDQRMLSLLHARIVKLGFSSDLVLANVLLDMYAKVGYLDDCIRMFDEMPERDVVSWCTLISGYVRHGLELDAFRSFRRMCRDGWKSNQFVVSSVLNACAASGLVELGVVVHGVVVKCGLGFDKFVEVGLVTMYAKCGCLDDAGKMFDEIPVKGGEVWNAMISGYFFEGFLVNAIGVCKEMCRLGFFLDLITLRVVSAAASALEMFELCKNLHVYCMKIGLDADSFVVAELVKLLIKIGEVDYAHKLHRKIKKPDPSLSSLLITCYKMHGYTEEAVGLAKELISKKLSSKEGALISVLSLCLHKNEGSQIHAYLFKSGCFSSLNVVNALISMYVGFGAMEDAKRTFHNMEVHDIVSWMTIMAGLVHNLQFTDAILLFHSLNKSGIQLDQHSVATVTSACTGLQDIRKGKQIHSLALKFGFVCSDYVNASILDLYAKCSCIDSAVRLFSFLTLPRSVVVVNAMLAGYCWNLQPKKALDLFRQERQVGLISDHFSYSIVLTACADMRSKGIGEQVHCCITKSGFEFSDIIIGNAIINLYVKSGCISYACKYFYNMKVRNSNSYTILMLGYAENSKSSEVLELLCQMQNKALHANPIVFPLVLRGCIDTATFHFSQLIHAVIIKIGLVLDVTTENELVHLYTKFKDSVRQKGISSEVQIVDNIMHPGLVDDYQQDVSLAGISTTLGLKNCRSDVPLIEEKEKTKQTSPDIYSIVLNEILQRDMLLWNIFHSTHAENTTVKVGS